MKILLKNSLIVLLVLAFLFRLVFASLGTLELDFNTFISWSINLSQNGLGNFYKSWSDYLPGYLYVLWALGKIRGFFPDVLLYKLPAILADIATGFLIYKIVAAIKNERLGKIAAGTYLFNPAIWTNSTLWGQVDSLTSFFSLFCIYLFDKAWYLSAVFLALGTSVKPQAAFAFPVIIFLFLKSKRKPIELFSFCFVGLITFISTFLPFWQGGSFFDFLMERFRVSISQYPYTSVNAFNFWGIFGFWSKDSWVSQTTGLLVAFIFSLSLGRRLSKKKNSQYALLSIIFSATFLFLTRIHERHLLPVFAPLTIAAFIEPVLFVPLIVFSSTYILNLYYAFVWITHDFKMVFSSFIASLISLANLGAFFVQVIETFKTKIVMRYLDKFLSYLKTKQKKETPLPKSVIGVKVTRIILVGILLLSLFSRIMKLNEPSEMYFDEIYHAFTAKLVLHNDPKAWEWWNPHPEGFAYEWTHPPLAKILMAGGMRIFGENSFGWRVPAALFGTGIVFLVYLLAKQFFKDELVGVLSAFIFAMDGLSLTMARIGMNDTYLVFFVLLTLYFFLKESNFLAALAFGLALSAKWSAVWTLPILFIIWIHRRNKLKLSILWFLVLPLVIYISTYLQMFLTGHDLGTFWGMQKQMWWYHTGLTATHAYGSSPLSWPFMVRPVYLFTSDEVGGWVSRIYAIGNPVVFWFGLASAFACFIYSLKEKNKTLALVVFSYLVFFLPWTASPRIMFLYHYLPVLPFLSIAAGYVLRRNFKLVIPVAVSCLILFIYFYPHWTGLKIPLWLDTSYYWFPSWR